MKPAKKYLKSLRKDLKSKKGMRNAAKFAIAFCALFLFGILVAIPATSGFWQGMGVWHANAVSGLLSSVFGIQNEVDGNIIFMGVQGQEYGFVVSQLCSGDVEVALLAALMLATFEVLLIWRVVGAVVGASVLLLMNPVRIAITLAITSGSGLETGDFYHSIIFRLFLFVLLVLCYFAWYNKTRGRKSQLQERITNALARK